MACNFFTSSGNHGQCEGCSMGDTNHVTYRVEVKQQLCDPCARERHQDILERDTGTRWFCAKHVTDKAKIFCCTHDILICEACALTTHRKTCDLIDVDDIIKERKEELCRLLDEVSGREGEAKEQCALSAERYNEVKGYFESEEEKLRLAYEAEVKKLTDTYKELASKLKQKSDLFTEKGQMVKIRCENMHQGIVDGRNEAAKLLQNDSGFLSGYQRLKKSFKGILDTTIPKQYMDDITSIAKKVFFIRKEGPEIGVIEEPIEKWVQEKELNMGTGSFSSMIGAVGPNEVALKSSEDHSFSVLCLDDGKKKKITKKTKSHYDLYRCVPLDQNRVACGSNEGELIIYDSSWKPLHVVQVVDNAEAIICVAKDKDGMVLANAVGDPDIKVYNPASGYLLRTIERNMAIYDMQSLSNGHVAVLTECSEGIDISVLDADGAVVASRHSHGGGVKALAVDRSQDSICCLLWDHVYADYAVDVMSSKLEVTAKRVVEFDPCFYSPSCLSPGPNCLSIYCDGKLLTYRKASRGLTEQLLNLFL